MNRSDTPSRLAAALLLLLTTSTGAAERRKPIDVLRLSEEGKVSIEAVAQDAYSLEVRVRNLTDEPVDAVFSPGLVADTYARFALFQVGGGGGTSGGSGGQSTGLLSAPEVQVAANQAAVVNIQTACLNFGAPEPTPKTVMMIKRVEDFSADPVFQYLLKDLASNPPGENVAQAAFWNVVDKLDWKRLSKLRTRRGSFSAEDLEAAQSRVETARSLALSAGRAEEKEKRIPPLRLTALSVMIHPDPRGRHQDAELARQALRRLRERWPGLDVSHRNFTPTPRLEGADAVAWCFLVRSTGPAKSPDLQVTPQRNFWHADRKRWRHESIGKPFQRTPPKEEIGDWLADQIEEYIASRSLVVERGDDDKLTIRNNSPLALKEASVSILGDRSRPLRLFDLALDPHGEMEAEIPETHREAFRAGKKLVAVGFKPATARRGD
jgi:ribosomal protein S18 acetylase RimI-like enzyme